MSLLRVLLFLAISCHRQVAAFVVTRPLLCSRQQATTSVLTSHFDDDEEENDISHELYWLHRTTTNQDSIYGLNDDDDLLFGESDDNDDDENEESLGKTIGQGKVVVCLPEIASAEECETLFSAAWEAAQNQAPTTARGRSRFSVSDPTVFDGNIVFTAEEILLRVMDYIDDAIPCIYDRLFDPTSSDWASRQPLNAAMEQPDTPPDPFLGETCMNLRDLYMSGALEWSEGEPAINIYQGGGYFGAHKDHLALTVLMPLTSGEDFEGGGTGFWAGNRDVDENPTRDPDLILKPSPGSALLFGGDVTHAGMPVSAGIRSVLVCSFSTVTPASNPDRLHGLQAPPKVSANFKGTL